MIETATKPTQCLHSERVNEFVETARLRRKAESVLKSLQRAKADCDKQLAHSNRSDALKDVTGASSLERTIDATRETIVVLDRKLANVRRRLNPHELELVAETC